MSEPNVAVLFFVAHRHLEKRVFDALWADGFAFTPAQGRLCARIGEGGTRVTDLAEMTQVTKQTAGFLVDQLEKGGFVERVPDPTDARARLVRLSAHGAAAQARAREIEKEVEAEWTAHLGVEGMDRLRATMARLREITDPYAVR